jgi:superoxide reductase
MTKLGDRFQEADWRKEKHAPAILCVDQVKADEFFEVKVGLGEEIAHPNTTEHHISWITLYFHPEGAKFTHQVGHFEFSAHGEHASGPNKGPVYTHHQVTMALKINQPGTLHALSLCNIHGLWETSKEIKLVE